MSIQIQTVMASELKTLSSTEFQQILNSDEIGQVDLSEYEITNDELITLHKIQSEKKKIVGTKKSEIRLIASAR